jgi:carbon-monoxide dehydrogenase medium subunit
MKALYPAEIEHYFAPRTISDALASLKNGGTDPHFIAGGMSLMQAIKSRMVRPSALIDLQHVAELKGIYFLEGEVKIGAMTRHRDVAAADLPPALQGLRDAAGHVGDRQVRNRGTIGGSLCWNYVAACAPATCIALDAYLRLLKADGSERVLKAEDFLLEPLQTARLDDEILVAASFPVPNERCGSAYKKWGLVADALPVVGICVSIQLDARGACHNARIAVAGLTSGPRRALAAEKILMGSSVEDKESFKEALGVAGEELSPQDDRYASAEYRKLLIQDLGISVIDSSFARAISGARS